MPPWVVEFHGSILDEIRKHLTSVQLAAFVRNVGRWEQHGPSLGSDYYKKVRTSKRGLFEFRVTVDKVEVRLLYVREDQTFHVFGWFAKKGWDIPKRHIEKAEALLEGWRSTPR